MTNLIGSYKHHHDFKIDNASRESCIMDKAPVAINRCGVSRCGE